MKMPKPLSYAIMPFRWLFDRLGLLKTLGLLVLVFWLLTRGSTVLFPLADVADGDRPDGSKTSVIAKTGSNIILYTVNFFDEIRTNITGQNIPVCQLRHYNIKTNITGPAGPEVEKQFKRLTDKIIFQVDKAKAGNIATSVKRVLNEWNYPVIVLPYMTETTATFRKTSDVMILRIDHLFQQRCGSEVVNKIAGFKTVHRMTFHESRFDWD